jgi:hypothetical protein
MTDNKEGLDGDLPGVLRQLVNGVRRKYSLSQSSPSCTERGEVVEIDGHRVDGS